VAAKDNAETLTVAGREVRVTNPDKPYFSAGVKLSKLDIVRYYLSVADGAVAGIRDRPVVLKRFVDGAEKQPFYQKRAPDNRPDWLRTVILSSTTPRAWRGSSTSAASSCTRTPCAPATSTTPTSCASISILDRASNGRTCVVSRSR